MMFMVLKHKLETLYTDWNMNKGNCWSSAHCSQYIINNDTFSGDPPILIRVSALISYIVKTTYYVEDKVLGDVLSTYSNWKLLKRYK